MRILILGRGPIGTEYGWALEKAGHKVEFLVRHGSAAKYGDSVELNLWDARENPDGELQNENWRIQLREDISDNESYDLIIVSVNHDKVEGAVNTIAPIVGNATILMFSNIWDELKTTAAPLPNDQIIWGFPGGGGGFEGNKLISGFMKSIFLESADSTASIERHQEVTALFENAGFSLDYQDNMQAWYWDHMIMNAAMSAVILKEKSYTNMFGSFLSLSEFAQLFKELLPLIEAKGETYPQSSTMLLQAPAEAIAQQYYDSYNSKNFVLTLMDKIEETGYLTAEMRMAYPRDVYKEALRLNVSVPKLESLKPYFML